MVPPFWRPVLFNRYILFVSLVTLPCLGLCWRSVIFPMFDQETTGAREILYPGLPFLCLEIFLISE